MPAPEGSDDLIDTLVWIKRKKLGAFALRERSFEKSLAALGRAGFDYNNANRALQMSREEAEERIFSAKN